MKILATFLALLLIVQAYSTALAYERPISPAAVLPPSGQTQPLLPKDNVILPASAEKSGPAENDAATTAVQSLSAVSVDSLVSGSFKDPEGTAKEINAINKNDTKSAGNRVVQMAGKFALSGGFSPRFMANLGPSLALLLLIAYLITRVIIEYRKNLNKERKKRGLPEYKYAPEGSAAAVYETLPKYLADVVLGCGMDLGSLMSSSSSSSEGAE